MEFKSEWLVKGLVESVFVVGSILMALAVDEWAENRGYAELADQTLGIFEREITQNRARLDDAAPYHRGIRDLLQQMLSSPDMGVDVRDVVEGLETPPLLRTAWETALATGALTHMEFEVVSALSLTYSIQDAFMQRSRIERPRIGPGEGMGPAQLADQTREAYDYVASLAADEAELLTVFQQALEVIRTHRGIGHVDVRADSSGALGDGT